MSGDPVRLEQIVGNLVSNALKFTRGEGIVSVFVGREGDDAVLRVADQGIGIPSDMLPKIFDLFVQAHHTIDRTRGGLGIGLTLVRRLAELHGGSVHAASEGDGRGSTFTVRIPTVAAPKVGKRHGGSAGQRQFDAPRPSSHAACCWWTTITIRARCIARCCARMATRYAKRPMASTRSRCCSSPPIARSTSRSSTSACPGGMDGYELARRIRTLPAGREVRLVALTGYGFPEDRQQSKLAGFARHLVKPVEPEALQRELSAVTPHMH